MEREFKRYRDCSITIIQSHPDAQFQASVADGQGKHIKSPKHINKNLVIVIAKKIIDRHLELLNNK